MNIFLLTLLTIWSVVCAVALVTVIATEYRQWRIEQRDRKAREERRSYFYKLIKNAEYGNKSAGCDFDGDLKFGGGWDYSEHPKVVDLRDNNSTLQHAAGDHVFHIFEEAEDDSND